MYTQIKLVQKTINCPAVVYFTTDKKTLPTVLSAAEAGFVKAELAAEKKLIVVNQYNKHVFIQLIEKKDKNVLMESLRKAGSQMADMINKLKVTEVLLTDAKLDDELLAVAEGMALANYQFLKYKTQAEKEKNKLQTIFLHADALKQKPKKVDQLQILVDSVCRARDLVNEPVIYLTATRLAEAFKKMGQEAGFKVEIFNKTKIESLKMGGLLAVNYGSVEPPTFTVMEYKPRNANNKRPYVLVGKGVVYDTGGLSLKPTPNSMDYMKCDMGGSAVVGATLYAIAKAKLPIHVIGLVPATDNRPGGNAYTPGDVITMMSGLTVEVLNTDAEGRMILADALHFAKQYDPKLVCEFSTLTGAAAAAIGQYGIVCMGTADEKVKNKLKESGDAVHERLAEFPFWDDYDELIKSDIAEIKNIGGPYGGAITAGKFLSRFADYPFMHFDIAGPAFIKGNDSYRGKNGTGVGVRLMFDFLKKL
ncbi:MAG: leucyl aminopeptidase [Bacteroidia bacterium]|nr:leucyl aminopeptidase [Bacteroidia bacterium]